MNDTAAEILRRVEAVAWGELRHAGGAASNVPQILAALLSHEPDVAEEGLGEFVQHLLHQGSLYPATAVAVSFVAAMVSVDALPHPIPVVTVLAEALGAAREALSAGSVSLPRARRVVEVYDEGARAASGIKPFLTDPRAPLREAALGYFAHLHHDDWWKHDVGGSVVLALQQPDGLEVQARKLDVFGAYFGAKGPGHHLVDEGGVQLVARAHAAFVAIARDRAAPLLVRLAALRALVPVQRAFRNARLEGFAFPDDFEGLFVELLRARHRGRATFREVDFEKIRAVVRIVVTDARLDGPFGGASIRSLLLGLVAAGDDLEPREAHALGCELLDFACERLPIDDRTLPFWKYDTRAQDGSVTYSLDARRPPKERTVRPSFRLNGKELVAAVVAWDRFWETKTNALSFFFGLPDERETLRTVVKTPS
jgi:hypothetical protein